MHVVNTDFGYTHTFAIKSVKIAESLLEEGFILNVDDEEAWVKKLRFFYENRGEILKFGERGKNSHAITPGIVTLKG